MDPTQASANRAAHTPELLVLDAEPGEFAFCRFHNVVIVAWPKRATPEAVARLKTVSIELNRDPPAGTCSAHLVGAGAAIPSAEARAAFIDLMNNHTRPLNSLSVVLSGGGFWASAVRSVVLGMRMVTPRSFALTFHTDYESSARWLAKESRDRGGVAFKPDDLARAMAEVMRLAKGESAPP